MSDGAAPLPRHVAFIMDGNGRWAEERGLPRVMGHEAGAEAVRRVVTFARRRGIPFLTLYAFSTENWSRPRAEVDALMELLGRFIVAELPVMLDNGVKLRIIGDRRKLSEQLRESLARAEDATARGSGLTLVLAINYGGRDEIVRAAASACERLRANGRDVGALDEALFSSCLDTAGMPDPDMLVRAAGERRLSNFLLWQGAYAELFFPAKRWPEFSDADFEELLAEYGRRVRKFGGLAE